MFTYDTNLLELLEILLVQLEFPLLQLPHQPSFRVNVNVRYNRRDVVHELGECLHITLTYRSQGRIASVHGKVLYFNRFRSIGSSHLLVNPPMGLGTSLTGSLWTLLAISLSIFFFAGFAEENEAGAAFSGSPFSILKWFSVKLNMRNPSGNWIKDMVNG